MMAAYLMRTGDAHGEDGGEREGWIMRSYTWLIKTTLRGRLQLCLPLLYPLYLLARLVRLPVTKPMLARASGWLSIPGRFVTLASAILFLAVSLYFMAQVPGSFIPPDDVSRISISVELPPGSRLTDTDRVTKQIRKEIAGIDGVENIFILGGASPKGDLDVRRASVSVILRKARPFAGPSPDAPGARKNTRRHN